MEDGFNDFLNMNSANGENFSDQDQEALVSLYKAILTLESVEEMHKFFKDLCSYNEICSMMHRWQILLKIHDGKSYEEIIKELAPKTNEDKTEDVKEPGKRSTRKGKGRSGTTVSSTTISRVKNCYVNPDGGYRTALRRLENQENDKCNRGEE